MTAINQKEYLKKYLSIGIEPGTKKKKKKKKAAKTIGDRYINVYYHSRVRYLEHKTVLFNQFCKEQEFLNTVKTKYVFAG